LPTSEQVNSVTKFIEGMLSREAAYHQHKEGAAYAGITLFAGVAGTAAVSRAWPPEWGPYANVLAILAATLLWAAVLVFLRFQLTRRRWAAMRVAACERVLAAWLQQPPSDSALARRPGEYRSPVSSCDMVANVLWGKAEAVRAVDVSESVYPSALVEELLAQEKRPTGALQHERLILVSGWILYVILIAAALLGHCP
jgi:hypothetical protein